MFAEINKNALHTLPFALATLGESRKQTPVHRPQGNSFHEVLWLRGGSGLFRIGEESRVLCEGEGMFVREGIPHSYEGEPFHTAWLTFRGGDGLLDFCDIPPYLFFRVPSFLESATAELQRLVETNSTPISRAAATCTYITDLIAAIRRPSEPPEERVRLYLENRYSEPLTLEDIAAYAGMNRYALCRYWRRVRGCGVMDELKQIRIAKAKRFLRFSSDPIERIGQMCGFESPSYFSKRFREVCGCTPAEYRKAHNG